MNLWSAGLDESRWYASTRFEPGVCENPWTKARRTSSALPPMLSSPHALRIAARRSPAVASAQRSRSVSLSSSSTGSVDGADSGEPRPWLCHLLGRWRGPGRSRLSPRQSLERGATRSPLRASPWARSRPRSPRVALRGSGEPDSEPGWTSRLGPAEEGGVVPQGRQSDHATVTGPDDEPRIGLR